ncbi:MAG: tripartite tricarboxylate transporter substrate binding protein [Pseudolabrys sp.]|nr:tripartite tricarboxylate transporter substrate binding protein [Pseudolabrys sp.]MDP2297966.1 tripartite tricarboxylate transporter substrate binding protein [Pseudolabrys sp.]
MLKSISLRRTLQLALPIAATLAVAPVTASAQEWPTRTVRIVVPNGPGGGTDIVSRILGDALSKSLGASFVVENKPGAGTTLGADTVAKAQPDGYTVLMMSNAHAVSGAGHPNLKYEPVKDFRMVSLVGTVPLALVTAPNFPPKTVKELVAAAKAEPGKFNFASVGAGTTQHFAGELFRVLAGIDIKHVPYRTTPAAITGMLSNDVHLTFELIPAIQGQVDGGKLKILAVTSPERFPAMPDVPTIAESGIPYNVTSWYGLAFPAGTPDAVVQKMNKAVREALANPDIVAQIKKTGISAKSSTSDELEKHVTSEIAKWKKLIADAGITKLE